MTYLDYKDKSQNQQNQIKKKSHKVRNVIILAIVVVLGLFSISILPKIHISPIFTPSSLPDQIQVSGTVVSTGGGTTVSQLKFYNSNNNFVSQALVNNGNYTVSLPNQNASYTISGDWKGNYTWQNGSVNSENTLIVNRTGSSSTSAKVLVFKTPDSVININGSAKTGFEGTGAFGYAKAINYSSSKLKSIVVPVNLGRYTANLPNMVNYHVSIIYENALLQNKSCSPGNDSLNVMPGTSSITEHWLC